MASISIFNDVLGPVMRGPSSSHTAASFYIGRLLRHLLGEEPASARFSFDPHGSVGRVYQGQGVDLGLASGLLGWEIIDDRFEQALQHAASHGLHLEFVLARLPDADHPNTLMAVIQSREGHTLHATAKSVGGGAVVLNLLDGWEVEFTGNAYEVALEAEKGVEPSVREGLAGMKSPCEAAERREAGKRIFLHQSFLDPPDPDSLSRLKSLPGVHKVWTAPPLFSLKRGKPLFRSAGEMVDLAGREGWSLGRAALAYEAELLRKPEKEIAAEMERRFHIMRKAVRQGMEDHRIRMQLLRPSAGRIFRAEAEGRLALGGIHSRAAARAMAVMHENCSMGVVCAAPTGGAAGVLPGVVVSLWEEKEVPLEKIVSALFAGSAVGVVVAERATFAAEIAGCQVEIGAAGAMAAAAVVEAAGGSARQAADAASIAFQNTMGSVCDLVQGIVEIPCHTRNAVAASSALVCADLILGGYENPIPLDETVDAVYAVGKMLPPELRVTSRGGLAATPSALRMKRLR